MNHSELLPRSESAVRSFGVDLGRHGLYSDGPRRTLEFDSHSAFVEYHADSWWFFTEHYGGLRCDIIIPPD